MVCYGRGAEETVATTTPPMTASHLTVQNTVIIVLRETLSTSHTFNINSKECLNEKLAPPPLGVSRKCDHDGCTSYFHPGCMTLSRGEANKELWEKPWFCEEHMPSRT
jgi:hypothetical protein